MGPFAFIDAADVDIDIDTHGGEGLNADERFERIPVLVIKMEGDEYGDEPEVATVRDARGDTHRVLAGYLIEVPA